MANFDVVGFLESQQHDRLGGAPGQDPTIHVISSVNGTLV